MKLNEEAPEQHLAIIVLGGIFLLINLISAWKAEHKNQASSPAAPEQLVTQIVDDQGRLIEQPTLHQNPALSWTELIFCRGLKRSTWCSRRELHPDTLEADEAGIPVANGPRKQDHVVAYRGPMQRESIFSSRVSIPEEDVSNRYLDIESRKGPGGEDVPLVEAPPPPGQ